MKKVLSIFTVSTALLTAAGAGIYNPLQAASDNPAIVPQMTLLLGGERDCNGDKDGTAYLDMCNGCVGGKTGNSPCSEVTSLTGRVWLDRNLGASRVAISPTDSAAYGDLYQWGRLTDGHQKRTSPTISILSDNVVPGHGYFILATSEPYGWLSSQTEGLWQGVSGTNNPCPTGFRLPSMDELGEEKASWSSNDAAGAFASPLKLVMAGMRSGHNNGMLGYVGSYGFYWSSTFDGSWAYGLSFKDDPTGNFGSVHAHGHSVRCIKD